MGKFIISLRTNGLYHFFLKAGNGQVILASEGYSSKAGCMNGIESVKKNGSDDSKFDRKTASNGKFYFNLKATNGQIIGTSEMFESEISRNRVIESVKHNILESTIIDQTT